MKSSVAGIDFGTSKIVTLVAETSGSQRCDIVGAGNVPYDGYLDGEWNSPDLLNEAIQKSISIAEEQSKRKIREINVGVPGEFTHVLPVEVSVDIQGADPKVTKEHVDQIFKLANQQVGSFRGVIVHRSPAWFMVSGGKKTLEPVGLKGSELKALVSFVVAETFFLDDVTARLKDLNISISGFFSSCAGEAMLYISEEERDRTALLVDVGYLSTDVMAVEGDAIIYHKTLPIGGGHIAADVSEGLDIPLVMAEELKRQYVYGVSTIAQKYTVSSSDGIRSQEFDQETVSKVLEPCVDELANMILDCLDDSGIRLGNWSKVYLTGGGLIINRGGKDYLAAKLQRTVCEVLKRTVKLSSPIYASSMGLMDLIIDAAESRNEQEPAGLFKQFFKNLFGY